MTLASSRLFWKVPLLTKKVVLGWLLPSNKCGTCGASAMTWSKCWRAETQLPALEDSLGTSGELFVHWLLYMLPIYICIFTNAKLMISKMWLMILVDLM